MAGRTDGRKKDRTEDWTDMRKKDSRTGRNESWKDRKTGRPAVLKGVCLALSLWFILRKRTSA